MPDVRRSIGASQRLRCARLNASPLFACGGTLSTLSDLFIASASGYFADQKLSGRRHHQQIGGELVDPTMNVLRFGWEGGKYLNNDAFTVQHTGIDNGTDIGGAPADRYVNRQMVINHVRIFRNELSATGKRSLSLPESPIPL